MKVQVTKEKICITESVVVNSGELNVNVCDFSLPDCFEGLVVTAMFNNIPVPLTGTRCYIPSLKKGTAILGVYAYKEGESGELSLMFSPQTASFYVNDGSYSEKISVEEKPTISEFEKYCAAVSSLSFPKTDVINEVELDTDFSDGKVYSASAVNTAFNDIAVILNDYRADTNAVNDKSEKISNKTNFVDSSSTNAQYPSAYAVYKSLAEQALKTDTVRNELQLEIDDVNNRVTLGKTELQESINDIQTVQRQLVDDKFEMESTVSDLSEAVSVLQSRTDNLNNEIVNNKGNISTLEEKAQALATDIDNISDSVEVLRELVNTRVTDTANAIKGVKNGVGQVDIDDISPLTHFFEVTVDGENSGNALIECRGKNMLDFTGRDFADFNPEGHTFTGNNMFMAISGNGIYKKNNGTFSFDEATQTITVSCKNVWFGLGLDFKVSANSKYISSTESITDGFGIVASFYDSAGKYISYISSVENKAFTTPENAEWMVVVFVCKVANTDGQFLCPQLEVGDIATEYQPFVAPQYETPDSYGKISAFKSAGPCMTIVSDNPELNISCRYNRDTTKAYNALVEAVIALGGNV